MKRISFLFLFHLCVICVCAQQETPVINGRMLSTYATLESGNRAFLDSIYTFRTGTEYAFINGNDYYPYHYRAKHKPLLFFQRDRMASITVSGRKYDNIVLQYDTFTDEVVFPELENNFGNKTFQIAINKDIISSFTLYFRDDTLRFRYFGGPDDRTGLPPGFYELAYDGPTRYLIKHRSVVHQRSGINEYFYAPTGYVKTENGYMKIVSNSKFFKMFGARSLEMRRIIERRNLNVRKAGKQDIINVLTLYDDQTGVSH